MQVQLTAITRPVIPECDTSGDLIAYCARVSNPENQHNKETAPRLLAYLAREHHWSPFEMASMTVRVTTTRDIARQMLRHRSFSFQEFCISGTSQITFELPGSKKRSAYKRTIAHLYQLQEKGGKLPSCARVFDENTRSFVRAGIKEIFQTGLKPMFRITLENGKSIECTKEHKFLTQSGFQSIEDAIGLQMRGATAVMTKPETAIGCNGVEAYKDKQWMENAKTVSVADGSGLAGIAALAGMTTHTIKKWLQRHGLQFTKAEVASYTPAWNKGVSGYQWGHHSEETIAKMRLSARHGSKSNLWRGGALRSERLKIADWCLSRRSDFLRAANYLCGKCPSTLNLELHHVETVASRPDLAYDPENIQVLCRKCHKAHHKTNGDTKIWREKSAGNTLTVNWSKVKHVECVGEQMTYDMEVDHESHNYVANGIVTHNSQRYAAVSPQPVIREARMQDAKNRQASNETDDEVLQAWWDLEQRLIADQAQDIYNKALERGIAKEVARAVLPEGLTETTLFMAGTIRSFIHYVGERKRIGVQKEHREIALAVQDILLTEFPALNALLN